MTPRTFLIDPVKDLNGHHFNMSISLLSASVASGRRAVWLGHRDLDQTAIPNDIRFVPAFSSTIYQNQLGLVGRTLGLFLGERHFIRKMLPETALEISIRRRTNLAILDGDRQRELDATLRDLQPTPADSLVIHSADPQTTEMVAVWASRRPKSSQPSIYIRTCWSDTDMPFGTYGGGFMEVAKRLSTIARCVVFSAETEAGARKFERVTALPCNHCPPFIDEQVLEAEPQNSRNDEITVGWLGDPRREKGAALLPAIVESTLRSQNGRRVKFLFQCFGKSKRWLDEINSQLDKFGLVVERVSSGTSRELYWQAFRRCDIFLIPYEAKSYPPERGSGIAIEAMLAGKPIVTTPGTFASTLVTPSTGVIASDPQSLAAGILNIAAQYTTFQAAARRRSEELLPSYRPASILKQLTTRSGDGPSPATIE